MQNFELLGHDVGEWDHNFLKFTAQFNQARTFINKFKEVKFLAHIKH